MGSVSKFKNTGAGLVLMALLVGGFISAGHADDQVHSSAAVTKDSGHGFRHFLRHLFFSNSSNSPTETASVPKSNASVLLPAESTAVDAWTSRAQNPSQASPISFFAHPVGIVQPAVTKTPIVQAQAP